MKRLSASLLGEFGVQGVTRVEFVTPFVAPYPFWVWLGTSTDAERDVLADDESVSDRIRRLAATESLAVLYEGFRVESKETVDRDYDGSWLYRLR